MSGISCSLVINSIFISIIALRLIFLENKVDKLESKVNELNNEKK